MRESELELEFGAVKSARRLFCGRIGWEGVEMKRSNFRDFREGVVDQRLGE